MKDCDDDRRLACREMSGVWITGMGKLSMKQREKRIGSVCSFHRGSRSHNPYWSFHRFFLSV